MLALSTGTCAAQNYIVVNSEKVFKSLDTYNTAVKSIEDATTKYQKEIDDAFNQLETDYNTYQSSKATYSTSQRQNAEQKIINRESEITKYQESIFGEDGVIAKQREQTIKPIQESVFKVIDTYAAEKGYTLVLDIASNPTVLYYAPSSDKTDEIIKLVNNK